jgi:wobble nucleotide-excising tRNase
MISSIPKIESFGVFSDFHWDNRIPLLKKYNLIYGWNYSGKTTLARVFRCFELNRVHEDFPEARVHLKATSGVIHDLASPGAVPLFRVFNSDFIHDNLSFTDGSATPILILGEKDIAKNKLLKDKTDEYETIELLIRFKKNEVEVSESSIEKMLTVYARDYIKIPLSVPNYDKTRFGPTVIECRNDYSKLLLDDVALQKYLSIHHSIEKKPSLFTLKPNLTSIVKLRNETEMLLAKVIVGGNPIPRLNDNPELEMWVNEGRPFHEGKDACQFCGCRLPSDLMDQLTEHFSADYEHLLSEIKDLRKLISSAQDEKIEIAHKSEIYPELSEKFAGEKNKLIKLLEARENTLAVLLKMLAEKEKKLFMNLNCPEIDDPTLRLDTVVTSLNKIISAHNARTEEFDKSRKEAFKIIEKHYAVLFNRDQKYDECLQKIELLKTEIKELDIKLVELNKEIRVLEQETSEVLKVAARINDLLIAYFGKNDLRIEVMENKRFRIDRQGSVAKNLSEGEKTAIAFAYFITQVQDGRYPLVETRVFIDDPISSLDANHLFNTYALIKTQLSGCKQLVISTHSFDFYNLVREWAMESEKETRKPQSEWKEWSIFLIRRSNDGNAVLEEIPKELLRFKSEYHYLFSILNNFFISNSTGFDCLLSLPNIVRRFMEAFGGIMIPLSKGLKSKMERIFKNEIERERVWKFINHYSHQTTITRSLIIPDTSECKAVVNACLKAVKDWDTEYFKDLESEVS